MLSVPEDLRGDVFIKKNDSVDLMIKQGFLHEEVREAALEPGAMMNEFGLTKWNVFIAWLNVSSQERKRF